MLNYYNTNLDGIIGNYGKKVLEKVSNLEFDIPEENELHTKNIADCSRGNIEAKNYVIKFIIQELRDIINENDIKTVLNVVTEQYNSYMNKQYEIYKNDISDVSQVNKMSYYQLLGACCSKEQQLKLDEIGSQIKNNPKVLALNVLAYEIYKAEYGLGKIEDIKEMNLNNIEVHGTNKIRIEACDGNWYTIEDYNFDNENDVYLVATRLLNQNAGGDLTTDQCERQTKLADGSRITVLLKPAAAENYLFIKKFDTFSPTIESMINNGTVNKEMVQDLKLMAKSRFNTVIIGGVNTGKSGFLKMYVGLVPVDYKIGMVDPTEDTNLGELYPNKDVVTLYETSEYSLNDQFSYLLTTNRHIIGISESKSYEVEQSLKGMLRGNSGSFLTLHTNAPKDVVDNIAWMCLENGIQQDMRVLRTRIASAVDIIVRLRQLPTGERRVDEICELYATGDFEHPFKLNAMWKWDYEKKVAVRVKNYKPSDDLIDKMRYYGCTSEEITAFCRE